MRIKLLAILTLAALTVFALACGDDDDDDTGDDANGDVSTTAPADATDDATDGTEPTEDAQGNGGEEAEFAILIADFAFEPSDFTINQGRVNFVVTNEDSASHTFTVYADEEYTEATDVNVSVGGEDSATSRGRLEAGDYFFRCEFHPDMQGTFTAE